MVSPSRSPAGFSVRASELADMIVSVVPIESVCEISTEYVVPISDRLFASGVYEDAVAPAMAVPSAYH